jgi:hypothetical protein
MQFACEGGREGTLSQIMLPKIDALYKAFLFVQKQIYYKFNDFLKIIAKF